ncbi:GntR family transcriptional regulator [Acetivibrio clariflavus]|uniref:Putative transcriptional regulator n=1 Tax=Acetivibrio clariflavus (strain DSM 19732 / NBRC 101661 / EBR45) TaxID=720554 RepID=G8M2T2_ACECE|nr:GntR family transcriptional regulator [Acetivibrio clariflavus]AEV68196.1 putative transcriptional regulator [Acetivibrio clariflavus DSM 19732]
MPWDLKSDRPIYPQLIEAIELKICSGVYPPGSKLKSVRDLAQEAAVNPNTMQRALAKLEEDGLIYTHRTSGRFVTEDANMVKQLRNKIAKEEINQLFQKMKILGFEKKEILDLISIMLEESDNK